MREHFVGRSPRLTAYFCGITLGLALLVAGVEAVRIGRVELSGASYAAYLLAGAFGGVLLAFVAGYLNGSLLASWMAGVVPAAGVLGDPLAAGSLPTLPRALATALAIGVLVGTAGFVLAVEKHRRDARRTDLPTPASRGDLLRLVAVSLLVSTALLVASGLL